MRQAHRGHRTGEDDYLDRLLQRAEDNGVEDIELIDAARLKRLEPHVRGSSALLSPCSGIVDSHALMLSYQADAEAAGGITLFAPRLSTRPLPAGKIQLRTGGSEAAELESRSRGQRRGPRRLGFLGAH